jgi:ATP-dependent Clp protease ATP-binding subunit ClpA
MSESEVPVHTPRYFSVLGAAEEAARGMSHGYVGVEHLFLAIIRDRHAVPTQVLATMADLDDVESALLSLLNSDGYKTGTRNIVLPGDTG